MTATACGSSSIQKDNSLEGKKATLDSLKAQQEKLGKQISTLQDEIGKLDTTAGSKEKAKLVALFALAPTSFTHYIDLQGSVEAVNTSNISPRGQGGVVRQLNIKQGDHVSQGQLLLKLDDAVQKMTSMKMYIVEVEGFADRTGPSTYNRELSRKRADAVVHYLAVEKSIPLRSIRELGVGSDFPNADNKTRAARKENRRVDVKIYSLDVTGTAPAESSMNTAKPSAQ